MPIPFLCLCILLMLSACNQDASFASTEEDPYSSSASTNIPTDSLRLSSVSVPSSSSALPPSSSSAKVQDTIFIPIYLSSSSVLRDTIYIPIRLSSSSLNSSGSTPSSPARSSSSILYSSASPKLSSSSCISSSSRAVSSSSYSSSSVSSSSAAPTSSSSASVPDGYTLLHVTGWNVQVPGKYYVTSTKGTMDISPTTGCSMTVNGSDITDSYQQPYTSPFTVEITGTCSSITFNGW